MCERNLGVAVIPNLLPEHNIRKIEKQVTYILVNVNTFNTWISRSLEEYLQHTSNPYQSMHHQFGYPLGERKRSTKDGPMAGNKDYN